jgi:phosphatidylserine/phosphatidylglycerophosphate/cardiolipin synthase-like enzyme
MDKNNSRILFSFNTDLIKEVIKEIDKSKKEIYLIHFWFSWKPIADALITASNRGVKVNLLVDERSLFDKMEDNKKKFDYSAVEYINKSTNKLYINFGSLSYNSLLHHKLILIDNNIITGSLNLYGASIKKNKEYIVIIKNNNFLKYEIINYFEKEIKNCLDYDKSLAILMDRNKLYKKIINKILSRCIKWMK